MRRAGVQKPWLKLCVSGYDHRMMVGVGICCGIKEEQFPLYEVAFRVSLFRLSSGFASFE